MLRRWCHSPTVVERGVGSTFAVMTAIGCDGAGLPGMLAASRSAGFDGETLVLVGADGARLGSLVRG